MVDAATASLDILTVSQERELHKSIKRGSFVVLVNKQTIIKWEDHQHNKQERVKFQQYHFFPFFFVLLLFFHRIEKQSSRGHALEHLESSGTKVNYMNGQSVLKLCVGKNRETNKHRSLTMNFILFTLQRVSFCALLKDSRHTWSLLGVNIG